MFPSAKKEVYDKYIPKSMSREEKKKYFEDNINIIHPNIEVLGSYEGSTKAIQCKCTIHNHVWNAIPYDLMKGKGCYYCGQEKAHKSKLYTHAEFLEKLGEIPDALKIIGVYERNNKGIECYCTIHNYTWYPTPRGLLSGHRCPKCAIEKYSQDYRMSHNEFVQRVYDRHPNIVILSDYVNYNTKVKCRCETHDYEWETYPSNLYNGRGCPLCNGRKHIVDHETFSRKMKEIHPNIRILEEYCSQSEKILFECCTCGNKWKATPNGLLHGNGCPVCGINKRSQKAVLSQDEYVNRIKILNPLIEVMGVYTGKENDILCKCKKCGYEWNNLAQTLHSRKCPLCNNQVVVRGVNDLTTTHPEIVPYIKDINDAYNNWCGSTKSIVFKCPLCGDEKDIAIRQAILNGYHCTFCDEGISTPNRIIRNLLKKLNAPNKRFEYSPNWAGLYRYDAYFEQNGLSYVVEMDGGFHYVNAPFNGTDTLEDAQRRDKEKDNLANEHGVIMIRIKCVPETLSNITRQIKQSLLSTIFNLDNINWRELLYYKESLLTEICECYNNLDKQSVSKVSQTLNISSPTVRKYLYRGTDLGMCNYAPAKKNTA